MFPSIGQFFARLFHKLFPPETQGCHYINGPETLPPPLTKEEEAQVLENIRQGVPGFPSKGTASAVLLTR